jgi:hypothetical protein
MFSAAVFPSALALLLAASDKPQVEPRRSGQDSSLTRAVFAEGRVWMRSDAGMVFSVSPDESERRTESLPEVVMDLCARNGHVAALTFVRNHWTLRRREGNTWVAEASFDAQSGGFVALHCTPQAVTVVTTSRILRVRNGKADAVVLSRPLPGSLVPNVHVEGDQLFVGVNYGEFGGGLFRADLKTGLVTLVDRRTGDLCEGLLNADCDPVHGIASEPWKPGCVVAAIGLVHRHPHGRLVEICGEDVRLLLSRPYKTVRPGSTGLEAISTVAFFGVARAGDVVLAVGNDGLYRVSAKSVERESLPTFRDVGGIRVSFDVPGIVLVLTDVNRRKSLSGSVPMLVPRE